MVEVDRGHGIRIEGSRTVERRKGRWGKGWGQDRGFEEKEGKMNNRPVGEGRSNWW